MTKKPRKRIIKVVLSPEEVRIDQEQKLKAKRIPSGKVYKRKPKHRNKPED